MAAYYIDLFSPETHEAFKRSSQEISGYRLRHQKVAKSIKKGDYFVCYVTKVSRWCGLLEVVEGPFIDSTPIFVTTDDPYVVRFKVKPLAWLDLEKAIPIHDASIWSHLSFTRDLQLDSMVWTGKVRSSLYKLQARDGEFLASEILGQATAGKVYPLTEAEQKKIKTHTVTTKDKVVTVSIPEETEAPPDTETPAAPETRESIKIQALVASIGEKMGLSIWIPRADRGGVLREWQGDHQPILDRLPLNYEEATLKTIEQIDVLWLKGRSIVRAFEIEHTTAVYSGILRMADLLALQPNMDIKLHIVAPSEKRDKVFSEIRRPVFSLLERGPLAERCTYLPYDSIKALYEQKHLAHLSDSVLDDYAEDAE